MLFLNFYCKIIYYVILYFIFYCKYSKIIYYEFFKEKVFISKENKK